MKQDPFKDRPERKIYCENCGAVGGDDDMWPVVFKSEEETQHVCLKCEGRSGDLKDYIRQHGSD